MKTAQLLKRAKTSAIVRELRRRGVLALILLALAATGCDYPLPFSKTWGADEEQNIQRAQCSIDHGARVWDGYIHSTHT